MAARTMSSRCWPRVPTYNSKIWYEFLFPFDVLIVYLIIQRRTELTLTSMLIFVMCLRFVTVVLVRSAILFSASGLSQDVSFVFSESLPCSVFHRLSLDFNQPHFFISNVYRDIRNKRIKTTHNSFRIYSFDFYATCSYSTICV
jgi:hypothetical protein